MNGRRETAKLRPLGVPISERAAWPAAAFASPSKAAKQANEHESALDGTTSFALMTICTWFRTQGHGSTLLLSCNGFAERARSVISGKPYEERGLALLFKAKASKTASCKLPQA